MQGERSLGLQPVDPHKFPARGGAGQKAEPPPRRLLQPQAQFLRELALRGRIIVLPGVQMSGTGGIPQARSHVLGQRALLDEHLARRIEDQHMHRPVAQTPRMHLGTQGAAGDLIMVIDHVKPLARSTGLYIRTHSCPFVASKI